MTRNIVDIIRNEITQEKTMEHQQVVPTEKAQIVVMYTYGSTTIFRFNTAKKAEKEYKALCAAWKKNSLPTRELHEVKADMFDGTVNLFKVTSICIVDHVKRAKFVPFQ